MVSVVGQPVYVKAMLMCAHQPHAHPPVQACHVRIVYVTPCLYPSLAAAYTERNLTCPPYINSNDRMDIFALATLLAAAGIPDGSLDSPLEETAPNGECTYTWLPGTGHFASASNDHLCALLCAFL